jgi:hypothetical protein
MKLKAKILSSLFIAMLVIGMTFAVPKAFAVITTVEWMSSVTELGDAVTKVDVVGDTFKMAIVIKNVANLYGFDIQANWNTLYVDYVSHTVTVPAQTFPAPNPPSPYGGALNSPPAPLMVVNAIDQAGGMPGADPASYAWFAYASMNPAPAQDGDCTVVVFTFTVTDQPFWFGGAVVPTDLLFHFTVTALANVGGTAIDHTPIDFHLNLYPRVFSYPTLPLLDVTPKAQVGGDAGFTFWADVSLTVSPFWDVAGFDFILHYDPALIKANSLDVDPDNWFGGPTGFYPGGVFVVLDTIDNVIGEVHIAFLGLPDSGTGAYTPAYGTGRLLTVQFESIYVSTTYPPPGCDLALWNPPPRPMPDPTNWDVTYFATDMAGMPHDRSYSPWNGQLGSPPIPHVIDNGHYTAKFQPLGRSIDVVTQYPDGFNGMGPGVASDAFGPQATVRLTATVTYNLNPVQQKLVTFEIWHGEFWWLLCNTTDENGVAWVEFGLPWPCDDPEGRVFGIWDATASVDIREVYVQDAISWQVGYLIDIVTVAGQPDNSFAIGDHLSFKISYTSISHQDREAYFTIVVYDELQVPIAWFFVGPITVPYGDGEIVLECKIVPKHTFVGLGYAYTNIYYLTPDHKAFLQYCPQNVLPIALTI